VDPRRWQALSRRLSEALHLRREPVAIAFSQRRPDGLPAFSAFGRAGDDGAGHEAAVASCVFWVQGEGRAFATVPDDHGCSIGRVTHGLAGPEEAAGADDVAALERAGWLDPCAVSSLPAVSVRPGAITYGPLGNLPEGVEPDVVLLRVNARQLMVLSDALPELSVEGKPQCHIVALAKERATPAASVGCALSRVRTGMAPEEMTCALPAAGLEDAVGRIATAAETATAVARYAAEDGRRRA